MATGGGVWVAAGVYRLFRLTLDDFIRSTYLHQESVRGLLTEDPVERNAALDRLFGLEVLRHVTEAVRKVKIADRQDKLQARLQALEGDMGARLAEARRRLDEARASGLQLGLSKTQLGLNHGSGLVSQATAELGALARESGSDPPAVETPTSDAGLSESAKSLQGYLRRLRQKLPEQRKIEQLARLKTDITAVQAEYSARMSEALAKKENVRAFENAHGDGDAMAKRVAASRRNLARLEGDRAGIKSRSKVIKDALQYLRDTGATTCPVCERSIAPNTLLPHLAAELEAHQTAELESIDARLAKAEEAKNAAEGEQRDHRKLVEELRRAERELEATRTEAARALKVTITPRDDPEALLKSRVEELDVEFKKLERPLREREIKLQRVEDWCEKMLQIATVLKEQANVEKLQALLDSAEVGQLRQAIVELEGLRETLDVLATAVTKVQTTLAGELIHVAQADIQQYYTRLCDHPYYDDLEITVEPRMVRGNLRNEYCIKALNRKDGEETLASQKFSTGQMNCVALAVYLALAKKEAYSHNLGFLVLDDPSQSLDSSHKQVLAELLRELADTKQVIVATHDTEFQSALLEKRFGEQTIVHRFGGCPKEGPEIRCDA